MNRTAIIIIFSIGLILFSNFWGYPPATASMTKASKEKIQEAFDPNLCLEINSLEALENYIDTSFKGQRNTAGFLNHIASIISLRFVHGYSYYSTDDNWIAAVSGKFIRSDLSAIVLPNEILKHRTAACSQQTIILMECVKHFGLEYRKVTFDHHFASEVKIEDHWNYIDVDLEVVSNKSLEELCATDSFLSLYKNKLPQNEIKYVLANPKYGEINQDAAPRAELFQKFSFFLSLNFYFFLSFMLMLIYYFYCFKLTTNPLL